MAEIDKSEKEALLEKIISLGAEVSAYDKSIRVVGILTIVACFAYGYVMH